MGLIKFKKTRMGAVAGYNFKVGSTFTIEYENFNPYITVMDAEANEEKITHDMIKAATLMGMGQMVLDINTWGQPTSAQKQIIASKYLVVLNDGRQCVLTVPASSDSLLLERVLF